MLKRLVLNRLQAVNLSPEESEALLERFEHNTLSEEDRRVAVQVLRATQASQALLEQPASGGRSAALRRPNTKPSVDGRWPRHRGVVIGARVVSGVRDMADVVGAARDANPRSWLCRVDGRRGRACDETPSRGHTESRRR